MSERFIITKHTAKKAGLHWDIRFQIPNSTLWFSAACRKDPILASQGQKLMISRTNDHSTKDALFIGTIPENEYGAGILEKYDDGVCEILEYKPHHIVINFKGKKIKGIYHMIKVIFNRKYNQRTFLFFKSKIQQGK